VGGVQRGARRPDQRARFVVLDGVAHLAALEDPPLINPLVADFLAG
jgi:pimeloyl-ACP methyl ester carboxylesterase